MALGHHVVFRLGANRVLAPDTASRQVVVRTLLDQPPELGLVGFGLGDDHGHFVARGGRAEAGELARRVEIGLAQRLPRCAGGFRPAALRPVEDQDHLRTLVDYLIDQDRKHGAGLDPLRWGTFLPDLLGLRVPGRALAGRVREELPRLRAEELRSHLAASWDVTPAPDFLRPAVELVFNLSSLEEYSEEGRTARRLAVSLVAGPASRAAALLGIGVRMVQRLRADPVDDPAAARAVVRCAALLTSQRQLDEAAARSGAPPGRSCRDK